MTTRGPASPGRRSPGRPPASLVDGRSADGRSASGRNASGRYAGSSRRDGALGALRRDGRGASLGRARPNRAAVPRPANRRPDPAAPPVSLSKEPQRGLAITTRAALLALTVCLVALTMAYPLRAYFTQRASIADLGDQQKQDQQAVADLRRTVAQYQNPASVQDEARRRLHFQLPGEKVYYLPAPPPPAHEDPSRVHTPAVADKRDRPWFDQLWGSAVETSK